MHTHSCVCSHTEVRYCGHCHTVYCLNCNQEWTAKSAWTWAYYPNYQSTGICGQASEGNITNLAQTVSPKCSHGA